MWCPNNISGDYLYNNVLRLQYRITAVKSLHQVMHDISTILMTIKLMGKVVLVHNTTHCYYCGRCIMYMHNSENLMKVGLISCGLQCESI